MNLMVYCWFTVNGRPPLVIVILELGSSLGIRSVTYSEHTLILLPLASCEVILMMSAGLLVGGERKFLI